MRRYLLPALLPGAAVLVVVSGILPLAGLAELWDRVWHILLFVTAMTVVTELLFAAGVFERLTTFVSRWGRGSVRLLWLLVVGLAVLSTVFLSLDTTAVLITPLVVLLARHAGLPPLPFALTVVWLANTASLLLPVSNLTNLLAQQKVGFTPWEFVQLLWAPAAVGILVPCLLLALLFRGPLRARYLPQPGTPAEDRFLLGAGALVLVLLLPALVSGLPVVIPAVVAGLLLIGVFAARSPATLSFRLVPWQPLLLAMSLFVLVEAGHAQGLSDALRPIAGSGESLADLLQLAAAGTFGANAVNNLPAYLALEPAADSPVRLAALLIGVNLGPLISPWASLATLLWADRLKGLGVPVSWPGFAVAGLVVVALTVPLAVVALWFVSGMP